MSAEIAKSINTDVFSMQNAFVVTDSNVYSLYGNFIKGRHYVMPSGEAHKNLQTVERILEEMTAGGCDRSTTLIALGGGVVGDTVGFAASIFMRGIKWINVPTTLLSQVDSGIGGKTGVDINHYKNIAGSFWLADRVIICTDFLKSLPKREWLCGCGEIIKHAYISKQVHDFVMPNLQKILMRDDDILAELIEKNVRFKEGVVDADFKESGLRKILNAGHTIGHAMEKIDNFRLSHGEYVAIGLIVETKMFAEKVNAKIAAEMEKACKMIVGEIPKYKAADIIDAALADKKNSGGKISFMIATSAGEVQEQLISRQDAERRLECL